MTTNWFDEDVAETYDEGCDPLPQAGLDLLAARGVAVSGIEMSAAMLQRLRAKVGGDEASIPVVLGDMATERVDGEFDLVHLVFNTIMNLTTQDAQVACFANAARHLRPGGTFLVETMTPALRLLPPGQRYVTSDVEAGHVGVDEYDAATQAMISHHAITRVDGLIERTSTPFRYVWPCELDLMARLTGLRLDQRWADWDRMPFTGESTSHVSMWTKD